MPKKFAMLGRTDAKRRRKARLKQHKNAVASENECLTCGKHADERERLNHSQEVVQSMRERCERDAALKKPRYWKLKWEKEAYAKGKAEGQAELIEKLKDEETIKKVQDITGRFLCSFIIRTAINVASESLGIGTVGADQPRASEGLAGSPDAIRGATPSNPKPEKLDCCVPIMVDCINCVCGEPLKKED